MSKLIDKLAVTCIMAVFFALFVFAGYAELKGWLHTP